MKKCRPCGYEWSSLSNECPLCQHPWTNSQYRIHLPSKEDIKKATKRIRSNWSEHERQKRIANDFHKTILVNLLSYTTNLTGRRTFSDPTQFPEH